MDDIRNINIDEALDRYLKLREDKAALKAQTEDISSAMKAIESTINQYSEATGLTNFGTGVAKCTVKQMIGYRCDPESWERIREWLLKNGHGHCLKKGMKDASLSELTEQGVVLPAGLEIVPYPRISVRKN